MWKVWKVSILTAACLCLIYLFTTIFTQNLLIDMYSEPVPAFFPLEAVDMIRKKQHTEAYLTMAFKIVCVPCVRGFSRWSTLTRALYDQQFPACDAVVGITSGGWIIALIMSQMMRKPCYKMKFSRYNNKDIFQKIATFRAGHEEALDSQTNTITISPSIQPTHHRLLLVDDSVGSGATMRICRRYLVDRGASVYSFAVCAPKAGIVDSCIFHSLSFIFPWGLDV
jgi:adenine/guanine phosphoribosyltransferase-like PRPP-binding protein